MNLNGLRSLVREINFSTHGLDATVTRPYPDDTAIATRAIWLLPLTEDAVDGSELQRKEPRRLLALRRDEVPTVPRGTIVDVPEWGSDVGARWRVDGVDRIDPDHTRVVVVADPLGPY